MRNAMQRNSCRCYIPATDLDCSRRRRPCCAGHCVALLCVAFHCSTWLRCDPLLFIVQGLQVDSMPKVSSRCRDRITMGRRPSLFHLMVRPRFTSALTHPILPRHSNEAQ